MKLTQPIAEQYAKYRSRYLFGIGSPYVGRSSPCVATLPNAQSQAQNTSVGFLRNINSDPGNPGTYLNADKLFLLAVGADAEATEAQPVTGISHGDSIIYSSFAALCFAAEFSITGDSQPLRLCASIILALQRLGTYQAGVGEDPNSPPFGYMLRADAVDDVADDENFCYWSTDSDNARQLEPSYDQYCALLGCLPLIRDLVNALPPVDPADAGVVTTINDTIDNRIATCVEYLSAASWSIHWYKGNDRTEPRRASRGADCFQTSYPFARIALAAHQPRHANLAEYFSNGISLFGLPPFPRNAAGESLVGAIKAGLTEKLPGIITDSIIDSLCDKTRDLIGMVYGGDVLYGLDKYLDGAGAVKDKIKAVLKGIGDITDAADTLAIEGLNAIGGFDGHLVAETTLLLARAVNRYYAKVTLEGFDGPFEMTLGDWLSLVGYRPPASLHLDFKFEYEFSAGGPPGWWPEIWTWDGWTQKVKVEFHEELDLTSLWKVPVPLDLLDPLLEYYLPAAGVLGDKFKPDLQMLLFLINLTAGTFTLWDTGVSPYRASRFLNNTYAMALTYRFASTFIPDGQEPNVASEILGDLSSAPEWFPKDLASAGDWNQNFRWMRGRTPAKNSSQVYAGMDFMLPLMLAASRPEVRSENSRLLRDALWPKFKDDDDMSGVFKLPFQGPYVGRMRVFDSKALPFENDTFISVGVAFSRAGGTGSVILHYRDWDATDVSEEFRSDSPGKLVVIPLSTHPVEAEISYIGQGHLLVQTGR